MKPKIKLLTPWFGPLPAWYSIFRSRIDANRIVEHELYEPPSLAWVNELVEQTIGVPCRKATHYNWCCDLRPLYAQLFPQKFDGFEWWGWCDLDIAVGNLDKLLPPLLDAHDVISTEFYIINGAMSLFRNVPETCNIYRKVDFASVLNDPGYCNFDEGGFNEVDQITQQVINKNPNITQTVNESGLRVHYDERSWSDGRDQIRTGIPSRCCGLHGDDLIEIPTGRELLLYHFNTKVWPLPNPYKFYLKEQSEFLKTGKSPKEPVEESPAFWDARVIKMQLEGEPTRMAIYHTTANEWERIQRHTAMIIQKFVQRGARILDAGCGLGHLPDALAKVRNDWNFVGVDYSPKMIEQAKERRPRQEFILADLRELPFPDDSFDWAVCRGVEGSIKTLVSTADWNRMQAEMLRVAKRLLLINLSCEHRVVERPS